MKNSQVIFLSSYLCGGKSTYCQNELGAYNHIVVSSIIKSMIGKDTRKELQDTADLDIKIAQNICSLLSADLEEIYVIDGIRQPSIYHYIKQWCISVGLQSEEMWLEVSIEECKKRFEAKSDGKENISFEKAFQRDIDLGLFDLKNLWKENGCTIIQNF